MKIRGLFLLACIAVAACEQAANPAAVRVHDSDWFQFEYPGDWTLSEQLSDEIHSLRLQGPEDALFQIIVHLDGKEQQLEPFARGHARQAGGSGSTFGLADRPARHGRLHGLRETFSLEDMAYEREYQVVNGNGQTAFLVSQTALANKLRVQTAFDRVFTSFHFK